MKHVYYGVKKQEQTVVYDYELDNLDYGLTHYHRTSSNFRYDKEQLEEYIVALKAKCQNIGHMIRVVDRVIESKVILYQTFHGHVCEVGDFIQFNKMKLSYGEDKVFAKVTSRIYEPIENVIYYSTGIVVETLPFDEEDFENKRLALLEKAEEIYDKHFPNVKVIIEEVSQEQEKEIAEESEAVKQKGFFGKLFEKLFK
jgi:hypothetical protein